MSFFPVPDYQFSSVLDISADFLIKNNIKLLMLDLDNTVASYSSDHPNPEVLQWIEELKSRDIVLCFVSNSRLPERVEQFAEEMDVPYIKAAQKPRTRGLRRSMEILTKHPEHCALVGDQIYTDVLAAKRAGVFAILVKPIRFSNPLFYIRFFFELPFRLIHRNRSI